MKKSILDYVGKTQLLSSYPIGFIRVDKKEVKNKHDALVLFANTVESLQEMASLEEYYDFKDKELFEIAMMFSDKYMSETNKTDLTKINGSEIIDFLNQITDDTEDFEDTNIITNSFVFSSQKVDLLKKEYVLYFDVYYNNWGAAQVIDGNEIRISPSKVSCILEEPFEGDGTNELIEKTLSEWFKTHEFKDNIEEEFEEAIIEIQQSLTEIEFTDIAGIDKQIEKLIKAKTYMK